MPDRGWAEKRLHTAQPSLSRQIHDLELEIGAQLLNRGPRGIELTAAGRVFLDHARIALLQVEAAGEAARRAARPPRTSFAIGFLTGYEMDWLPAIMEILHTELPSTEVVIHSQDSPELATDLVRGRIDIAFLRPEKQAPGLKLSAGRCGKGSAGSCWMSRGHALASRAPLDLVPAAIIAGADLSSVCLRDPGADAARGDRGLCQTLGHCPEAQTSGRKSRNGNFAGGVHRRRLPGAALRAKPAAEDRRQPPDSRRAADG